MNGTVVFKMSGSGNDFVFVDGRASPPDQWPPERIRAVCSRRSGVGADGLVILQPGSRPGGVRFHFFNRDGSRADMCGNAALCAARLATWLELAVGCLTLETDGGLVEAQCLAGEMAELSLGDAGPIQPVSIPLAEGEQSIGLVTVGVPHLVVVVSDLQAVPLASRGRDLRFDPGAGPAGANVNFVAQDQGGWAMRTYERGVEAETMACGTGAVACLISLAAAGAAYPPWSVRTASGRELAVSAELADDGVLRQIRLAGEGRLTFRAILESVP